MLQLYLCVKYERSNRITSRRHVKVACGWTKIIICIGDCMWASKENHPQYVGKVAMYRRSTSVPYDLYWSPLVMEIEVSDVENKISELCFVVFIKSKPMKLNERYHSFKALCGLCYFGKHYWGYKIVIHCLWNWCDYHTYQISVSFTAREWPMPMHRILQRSRMIKNCITLFPWLRFQIVYSWNYKKRIESICNIYYTEQIFFQMIMNVWDTFIQGRCAIYFCNQSFVRCY